MTRSRWLVLLGPPLILILGVGAATAAGRAAPATAGAPSVSRPLTACPAPGSRGAAVGSGGAAAAGARPAAAGSAAGAATSNAKLVGAWWRSTPVLDGTGSLTGWTLVAGAPGRGAAKLDLPASSSASGPDRGRVIVAVDDGTRSSIHVVDTGRGCEAVVDLGRLVARRAIADPSGDGLLVHLLDRASRADLGIWHVSPDGRRTLVLAPLDDASRAAAGIPRIWATNLLAMRDGRRLAVQSCDPEKCLTRILERASGLVTSLIGGQGDLIGFSGDRLVTWAACHGLPCGVVAWSPKGDPAVLADRAIGAAVAADGPVVIAVQSGEAEAHALAIDAGTRGVRDIGSLAGGALPLPGVAANAGIETAPDSVGLVSPSGTTSEMEVLP